MTHKILLIQVHQPIIEQYCELCTKAVGQDIALYLALKLIPMGAIAIFCGRKDTASGLCKKLTDHFSRELPFKKPSEYSDEIEIERLVYLIEGNLGKKSPISQSAKMGVFAHHGNIPHGIRLAVEHAMRENLIRFVICTSTLAQGVNLPIRYLIVTSIYQGKGQISVRDFHNLIGRAGRAGMHTEGSIIFSDPNIYDMKEHWRDKWRWENVKDILEPENSEPCASTLLSIFDPIKSDDGDSHVIMEPLDFIKRYIDNPMSIPMLPEELAQQFSDEGFTEKEITRQVDWKVNLITSLESFLLSHWDDFGENYLDEEVITLAKETLAYSLADDSVKLNILELFKLLAENISSKVADPIRRKIYGQTLYGIQASEEIEKWLELNIEQLSELNTSDDCKRRSKSAAPGVVRSAVQKYSALFPHLV